MGFDDDVCNTGLVLGLGFSSAVEISNQRPKKAAPRNFEPSLTLGIVAEEVDDDDPEVLYRHGSGGTSSFSNSSVKRERDVGSEEVERERVCSRISTTDEDDDGSNNNTRKKLRLNKDQSAVLEESFKQHSTLNPKQKQELARKLNMKPRQVEVWFQNRRARTKLKQTEVDCEFLKKCCETLNEENRRLQKELQELKALKLSQPFYMAATLTMCPSCERIGSGGATADTTASKSPFSMAPNPHFFKPFTHPSAAC